MMLWTLCAWTLLLLNSFTRGHDAPQRGYTLWLSGYHVCPGTELVPMMTVIPYQSAYTQMVPCGGWLPWNMCNVTRYNTVYQTQNVTLEKAAMKCCEGYEQVGSYCALALNRSSEFTAKPGICPVHLISTSGPRCLRDLDCPDWQKCCQTENQGVCVEPQPHVNVTSWLNVTITVKAAYGLVNTSRGIFNHTRLLHSVVTGSLNFQQVSVYHTHSWSSGWFSTSSCLLLASSQLLSLTSISDSLRLLLENIEEVTAVDVRDVDECATPVLRECSPLAHCTNTLGSYNCTCAAGSADLQPSRPGTRCTNTSSHSSSSSSSSGSGSSDWNIISFGPLRKPPRKVISTTLSTTTSSTPPSSPSTAFFNTPFTYPPPVSTCSSNSNLIPELRLPKIINLWAKHVTSFSFHLFWDAPSQFTLTTNISLFHGTHQLDTAVTELSDWTWTNLQPGVLYTARVALCMCGSCGNATKLKVKTDAQTLKAVARITNIFFNDALRNPNSEEYKIFTEQVRNETLLSLLSWILDLVHSGQVMVLITNLTEGSVVVTFTLVFLPNSTQDIYSIASNLMESLQNSKQFTLDINSIKITDLNECAVGDADCSPWAECKDIFGSYTCECLYGYTDANPERPGRTCQANSMLTSSSSPDTTSPSTKSITTPSTTNSFTTSTTTTIITSDPVNTETPTSSSSSALPTSSSMSSSSSTNSIAVTHGTNVTVSSSTAQSESKPGELTTTLSTTSSSTPPSTNSTTQATETTPLNFTSHITVECSTGFMIVTVSHHFLEQKRISASSLYLGVPSCKQTDGNETHVMLFVAWGKCETELKKNSQNSTVQVTLFSTEARLQVPVICTYINSFIISAGYTSSGYDTINNVVEGSGMYHVTVRLLNGTDPLPQNYTLSPDDEVIIEVGLSSNMTQIKVVINQCWANPSYDPNKTPQNIFLENSCPVPARYTTVLQNGESTRSLLAVNLFHLVEFDIIYLHCQIQICIETSTATCRPDCSTAPKLARTIKGANVIGMTKASYGPLLKPHLDSLQATVWKMPTIGFILLALGMCVLALAALAVVLFCRRRTGNYNFQFKPRKENFTYHVFDT